MPTLQTSGGHRTSKIRPETQHSGCDAHPTNYKLYKLEAIARTLAGEFQGIVTAPIAKSLWKAAGHHYPGQTEFFCRGGFKR